LKSKYKKLVSILFLCGFYILNLCFSNSYADTPSEKERIVLYTKYGYLVLALYPDVAPNHVAQIKKLVKLNAYDSTQFFRIEEGFVIQLSDVLNRISPLSDAQRNANKPIKDEISEKLKHIKGTLSMARWDNIDSATSSFSILLDNAPHLDNKYTIIGHLESGGEVVNRILRAPREGTNPINPILVKQAWIENDISKFYKNHSIDPAAVISPQPLRAKSVKNTSKTGSNNTENQQWLAYLTIVMLILSSFAYAFSNKLTKSHLLSLHIVNILIGGFIVFVIFLPLGHEIPGLAALLFVALFALFRTMSRFENK